MTVRSKVRVRRGARATRFIADDSSRPGWRAAASPDQMPTPPPPSVALTFDDGPHPTATDAILDLLARRGTPAAFFLIGANVVRYPDVVRRIHERGHLIGNHSFHHAYHGLCYLERYWSNEIARTDDAIESVIGRRPAMFRPPMGFKHRPMMKAMRRQGHIMVTWSRRGRDGLGTTSERIVRRLAGCRPGDIALLHDGVVPGGRRDPAATIASVAPLIDALHASGISIVGLDQLIDRPAYRTDHPASSIGSSVK